MIFRRTRCPHCRGKLDQGQKIHPACIDAYAEAEEAKAKRKAMKQAVMQAKVERAETRRRKEDIKTLPQLLREAQNEFNAWIRARDAEQPCISCGAPPPDLSGLHAGRDAGHYRSVGSAPHLRFNPDNCHAQCVKCNQWDAGRVVDYRIRLLLRIGMGRVEAVELDNRIHKWTKDEVRAIRDHYRAKAKELKRMGSDSG